jgi:AcrR family transcriptional regulator
MTLRDTRRAAALERVADYMLAHGLALSSVRALAQAAGTSDRMLFYYFADKDEIVRAALQIVSGRFAAVLLAALPPGPTQPPRVVLAELAAIMRGQALRPYMRLFLELVTLSARGEEPYRSVAGLMADGFVAWVASRLDAPDEAARVVALLDGLLVLDLAGRETIGDLALKEGSKDVLF